MLISVSVCCIDRASSLQLTSQRQFEIIMLSVTTIPNAEYGGYMALYR